MHAALLIAAVIAICIAYGVMQSNGICDDDVLRIINKATDPIDKTTIIEETQRRGTLVDNSLDRLVRKKKIEVIQEGEVEMYISLELARRRTSNGGW